MTMTLKQVRDWLVEVRKRNAVNATLDDLDDHDADAVIRAIDAHLAGMGEPVAYCCPTDPYNSTAFAWPGTARVISRHTTPLFAAPPIDLAAVREVIESHINEAKNLRHDPESQNYLYAQADKLETAIRGEPS